MEKARMRMKTLPSSFSTGPGQRNRLRPMCIRKTKATALAGPRSISMTRSSRSVRVFFARCLSQMPTSVSNTREMRKASAM